MKNITPLAAFKDNYIWALANADHTHAVVVDPGDAKPVIAWLQANHLTLDSILITHHHWDHVNGVATLVDQFQPRVYGPVDSTPHLCDSVVEGDQIHIAALDMTFSILATPGHTLDHIAYHAKPLSSKPLLFSGDTLFAGGCGRLFEGSYEQLWHSLQKLAALPPETQVYCTHEYTLANLEFAHLLAADWQAITQRLHTVRQLRQNNHITLPTNITLECDTNPFLLCNNATFRQQCFDTHAEQHDALQAFIALRKAKDTFTI